MTSHRDPVLWLSSPFGTLGTTLGTNHFFGIWKAPPLQLTSLSLAHYTTCCVTLRCNRDTLDGVKVHSPFFVTQS